MIGNILILVCLILLNAVFVSAEAALISVNKNRVKLDAEEGNKKAIKLLKAIEEPSKYLATIQIGISFISLFSGIYAAEAFSATIVNALTNMGLGVSDAFLKTITFVTITVVLSYFTLVFGELIPKRLGMKRSVFISYKMISFLVFLSKLSAPFVKILHVSTEAVLKIFRFDIDGKDDDITEEEIRMLVDVGGEIGSIDVREQAMINNIFEFDNKTASDICTHRTDVLALPKDVEYDELMKFLIEQKYSRIPIYEENLDDIIGILHVKDIMKYVLNHEGIKEIDISNVIREAHFVPSSKKVDELFKEMQEKQVHMVIVVDEYGGTEGIVTMEVIVEEIMGSILDEHDPLEIPDISKIDENTYLLNGTTDLEIVDNLFEEVNLPIDEYDTLSGFLIGQLGRIPEEGEKPEVEYEGLLFKVDVVEEKRISSILICTL